MFLHDILKIKYVRLGFIKKNYPYHLISDEEMFNAFIDLGNETFNTTTSMIDPSVRFFDINYPNPFATEDYVYQKKDAQGEIISEVSLSSVYSELKSQMISYINSYLAVRGTVDEYMYKIPDWVYTYMLGEVIYNNSEYLDIQDILELLGCSNIDNVFTREACITCYKVSSDYISTLVKNIRTPTIFGEPHIIKSLRMNN